jgi:hypothetical protein
MALDMTGGTPIWGSSALVCAPTLLAAATNVKQIQHTNLRFMKPPTNTSEVKSLMSWRLK